MVKAIRKETEPFTINDSQLNRYHKRKRLMNKCEVVIGKGILCQISIELPKDKNFAIIHFGRQIIIIWRFLCVAVTIKAVKNDSCRGKGESHGQTNGTKTRSRRICGESY